MPRTMHKLNDDEMQALAEELIEKPLPKARRHVRRLDRDVVLDLFRVGVGPEVLTRYRLPNLGVTVTLVEMPDGEEQTSHDPAYQPRIKATPEFAEVRVEPLE
jgi:uncharacterized hydantoinase/oxoprolinase family protein